MPSAAARQLYESQIPPFMSVFGADSHIMDGRDPVTVMDTNIMDIDLAKLPRATQPQFDAAAAHPTDPAHRHSHSAQIQPPESAESSPTTTTSCTDTSSLSDPSTSSSPDSPVNLLPLSSLTVTSFGGMSGLSTLGAHGRPTPQRPMTSPAPRRPKNMKGLSIQPPFNSLSGNLGSEPPSPSFIKPVIPAMKRKPSQLSMNTNSSDLTNRGLLDVPISPTVAPIHQRRALKHSTSSPHMLYGLKSATYGPAGGMTIPTVLERNESGLSALLRPTKTGATNAVDSTILEEDSPIRTQVASRAAFEVEPFHEIENNEDQKTPGYPDGPIAIYGDNVFLYLEPNAEEASRFDVVINVAREVRNPFDAELRDCTFPDTPNAPPLTAASYATAFEFLPDEFTSTTAKQAVPLKQPEYIHMPWDHNTDIGKDLMTLCETIERKTKEGKKVLVHCQQGASRSASLIIAYGMYQNPELSVNDAYYAAQAKSQWISPNMRLMYCLQDFQKELAERKMPASSICRPRSGRSPSKHRFTLSADDIVLSPKMPLTAPLPGGDTATRATSPERSQNRARCNSTSILKQAKLLGPSSAPSSFSWATWENDTVRSRRFEKSLLDAKNRPHQLQFGLEPPAFKALPQTPPSPGIGFAPMSLSRRPPSPGIPLVCFSKPPPSPVFASPSFAKPPASPGFAPMSPLKPPPSPCLSSFDSILKPPSPEYGPCRFAGHSERRRTDPLCLSASFKRSVGQDPPANAFEHVPATFNYPDDAVLRSPRVETMTNNPLYGTFEPRGVMGMHFVEVTPSPHDGLFSPRETMYPRNPLYPFARAAQVADPRSPPTKGETPIVRSIDDFI